MFKSIVGVDKQLCFFCVFNLICWFIALNYSFHVLALGNFSLHENLSKLNFQLSMMLTLFLTNYHSTFPNYVIEWWFLSARRFFRTSKIAFGWCDYSASSILCSNSFYRIICCPHKISKFRSLFPIPAQYLRLNPLSLDNNIFDSVSRRHMSGSPIPNRNYWRS